MNEGKDQLIHKEDAAKPGSMNQFINFSYKKLAHWDLQ